MRAITLFALTLLLPAWASQAPKETGETVTIDGATHPNRFRNGCVGGLIPVHRDQR